MNSPRPNMHSARCRGTAAHTAVREAPNVTRRLAPPGVTGWRGEGYSPSREESMGDLGPLHTLRVAQERTLFNLSASPSPEVQHSLN